MVIELSYKEESWRRSNREVPVAQVVRAPARNVGDLGSTPGGAFIFASAPSLFASTMLKDSAKEARLGTLFEDYFSSPPTFDIETLLFTPPIVP